jgi:hypothetical protein
VAIASTRIRRIGVESASQPRQGVRVPVVLFVDQLVHSGRSTQSSTLAIASDRTCTQLRRCQRTTADGMGGADIAEYATARIAAKDLQVQVQDSIGAVDMESTRRSKTYYDKPSAFRLIDTTTLQLDGWLVGWLVHYFITTVEQQIACSVRFKFCMIHACIATQQQ